MLLFRLNPMNWPLLQRYTKRQTDDGQTERWTGVTVSQPDEQKLVSVTNLAFVPFEPNELARGTQRQTARQPDSQTDRQTDGRATDRWAETGCRGLLLVD